MTSWTVIEHTALDNGCVIGGCVEVGGRLYTVVACPDTRTLGELAVDVQVRHPDGQPLMWVDIHTEPFVVIKTVEAAGPDADRLIVTVNADGIFVARAVIVPHRVEVGEMESPPPAGGITGRLPGPHPRLVEPS
jgi:sugar lactone lactonase YvrE